MKMSERIASAVESVAGDFDTLGASYGRIAELLETLSEAADPMAALEERIELARRLADVKTATASVDDAISGLGLAFAVTQRPSSPPKGARA